MERLPPEMLELIVGQLTPQDLANCSAVSRAWRQVFNQDWIWEKHCDAELEETLRTTACVATPAFTSPEVEISSLPPKCQWRLAFMRENHMWRNWKETGIDDNEKVQKIESEDLVHLDFLTDTLVVVWNTTCIEILDTSVNPAVCVAKTDALISIGLYDICSVVGATTLLVVGKAVQVYEVHLTNKLIKSKCKFYLDQYQWRGFQKFVTRTLVKEHYFLFVNTERSNIQIYDLNTGKKLKEEPYPVTNNQTTVKRLKLKSFPTSDFVSVVFGSWNSANCYFYNIKQLNFLPDVAIEIPIFQNYSPISFALHKEWFAYYDEDKIDYSRTLTVYNLKEKKVQVTYESIFDLDFRIHVYDNKFMFLETTSNFGKFWLKSYSPELETFTTVLQSQNKSLKVMRFTGGINNKFFVKEYCTKYFWKISGQALKKIYCDNGIEWDSVCKINQSCTKLLYQKPYLRCIKTAFVVHFW